MLQTKECMRASFARYFIKKGETLEEDKAYVMADDLWDRAAHKDKNAVVKLGEIYEMYKKGELT